MLEFALQSTLVNICLRWLPDIRTTSKILLVREVLGRQPVEPKAHLQMPTQTLLEETRTLEMLQAPTTILIRGEFPQISP